MKNPLKEVAKQDIDITFPLHAVMDANTRIEPTYYFMALNEHLPCVLYYYEEFKLEELLQALLEKYKLSNDAVWTYHDYHKNDKKMVLGIVLIEIRPNFLLYIYNDDNDTRILYDAGVTKEEIDDLQSFLLTFIKEVLVKAESKIFLLYENRGLHLRDFHVKPYEMNLLENYNDDFLPVHSYIVERLNALNDKGIVFLHGTPGTGKTSYIRYLTSQINKRLIYISPEFAHKIASPDFLPLLIDNPNSVLIIEDAENLIAERENSNNVSVSSLLNIADGLLSDCLSIQIICTFNTNINKVDKALLRKGRLIASYEFTALSREKAQNLSNKLGFTHTINKEMTLTDIYNQFENEYALAEVKKIGFH